MTREADKEPVKKAVKDNDESIGLMEPMLVSETANKRSALADLAVELTAKSTGFRRRLPDGVVHALS